MTGYRAKISTKKGVKKRRGPGVFVEISRNPALPFPALNRLSKHALKSTISSKREGLPVPKLLSFSQAQARGRGMPCNGKSPRF